MSVKKLALYLAALAALSILAFAEKEVKQYCDQCGADLGK